MIQWGYYKASGDSYTLYFPTAFSSKVYAIVGMNDHSNGGSGNASMRVTEKEPNYATLRTTTWENNWIALGY